MADDEQHHPDDTPAHTREEEPTSEGGVAWDDLADVEDDPADRAEEAHVGERTTFVANPANQAFIGTLTLHYVERNVTLLLDGDAALRVMKAHQRRSHAGAGDLLEPSITSAHTAWVTLDPQEPLAMSWMPRLPSRPARMAIDPPAELLGG